MKSILFLKYCPKKKRSMAPHYGYDTSCRTYEILSLRIGDIKFKMSLTGMQYAEVHITDSKTKPVNLYLFSLFHMLKNGLNYAL